jgi:type I restriction enzyme S subunit
MKIKINKIALQMRNRIPISSIHAEDYVSTDNMRPNFGGIEVSSSLPPSGNVTAYQAGDILLSNIRPYFRKTWFATHSGGCNADVLCIRADPEKCIPQYLYYLLTTDNFVEDYLKSCKGAKMPRGNVQRLLDYEFNLPDLPTQLRIAAILGSIDEKIELNRKKIAELESLAKTIYDYWFIQFDFPDENGKPYKSSGGKMVWNEQLKREIPEGWEVKRLTEIAEYLFGYPFDSSLFNNTNIGFPIVRIRNVKDGITQDRTTESTNKDYIISNGDFLIGMDGYFDMNHWTGGDAYLVQRTCRIKAKEALYNGWLSLALYTPIKHLEKSLSGATLAHLGKLHLDEILLTLPPKSITEAALTLINTTIQRKVSLGVEVQKLAKQRDTLLPLLMNGQVEVK